MFDDGSNTKKKMKAKVPNLAAKPLGGNASKGRIKSGATGAKNKSKERIISPTSSKSSERTNIQFFKTAKKNL